MANATSPTFLLIALLCIGSVQLAFLTEDNLNNVVERSVLMTLRYDNICQEKYMVNIKRLVYLKSFMNFEKNPRSMLPELKNKIIKELTRYHKIAEQFAQDLESEIKNIDKLPVRYMLAKTNAINRRAFLDLSGKLESDDKPDSLDKLPIGSDPNVEGLDSLKASLKDVEAELSVIPFDFHYLENAKEQIYNHRKEPAFEVPIQSFIRKLPSNLEKILDHVIENYSPATADKLTYLIDYFNVFGSLIEPRQFYQMVLKKLTHHPRVVPKFQSEDLAPMLKDPKIFDLPNIELSPFAPILTVERLLANEDPALKDIHNIRKLHKPTYAFHPTWLPFFDIPKKEQDPGMLKITHENPEKRKKIIEKAHKYIYYAYTNARKENKVPVTLDDPKQIADLLYKEILTTPCYVDEANQCDMAKLIPRQKFARYFIPMLTLLKPFTSEPERFSEDDMKKIVDLSTNLGSADSQKYVPSIVAHFPDFKKKNIKEKVNKLDEQLIDLTEGMKQANKDKDGDNFIKKRKDHKKTLTENLPKMEKTFDALYPELSKLPQKPEELQIFLDDVTALTDTIDNTTPEIGDVIVQLIKKKITDIAENEAKVGTNESMNKIKTRINEWTVKQVLKNTEIPENHGFVKYLDHTVFVHSGMIAIGSDYFKSTEHNNMRKLDLYVFNYALKNKIFDDQRDQNSLKTVKETLKKYEQLDVDEFSRDLSVFENTANFQFMISFFNLFSLFESHHSGPENGEANKGAAYGHIFDKLYKFLVDVRVLQPLSEEAPMWTAWVQLNYCMNQHYDFLINDEALFEPYAEDIDNAASESDLAEAKENARKFAPCKQSYAELSSFYYFFVMEAMRTLKDVTDEHKEYVKSHPIVNTDILFSYLDNSENWLRTRFTNFCDETQDYICTAKDVYSGVMGALANNDFKLIHDQALAASFISDKLKNVRKVEGISEERARFAVWDLLIGINFEGIKKTNNYDVLLGIIDGNIDLLKDMKLTDPLQASNHVENFAKFLALRFHRDIATDTADQKIAAAVKVLFTDNRYKEFITSSLMIAANAKFLLEYSSEFAHFKKISEELSKHGQMSMVLRWTNSVQEKTITIRAQVGQLTTNEQVIGLIKSIFAENDQTMATATKQVTEAAKKPSGPKGIPMRQQKNAEVKVKSDNVSLEVQPVNHQSKISKATNGRKPNNCEELNDLEFTEIEAVLNQRVQPETVRKAILEQASDPKITANQIVIIDADADVFDIIAKEAGQLAVKETIIKLRRRVVV